MRRKHERDTGVRGSPQTQGYVHQMVASCNIYYHKELQSAQLMLPTSFCFHLESTSKLTSTRVKMLQEFLEVLSNVLTNILITLEGVW